MKTQSITQPIFVLLMGCCLAACQSPPAELPAPPATELAVVATDGPTPIIPLANTPTATATSTATMATPATPSNVPTRTPRPTATSTATPVPLSGRIAFVAYREDTDGDGWLSFTDNGRIITLDILTGETRALTDGSVSDSAPTWSPDGRQIAFVSNLGNNQGVELFVIDSDGGSPRRLTTTAEDEAAPSWSPDGAEIVFLRRWWDDTLETYVGDLYVMDVTSEATRQLTDSPGLEYEPQWSPDGRFIAYSRDTIQPELNRRRQEIYLLDVATGEEWLLTASLPYMSTQHFMQDFMEPKWPGCEPLTISFTVREISSNELEGIASFYVALYELAWADGQPVLTPRGRFGELSVWPDSYTWGPGCGWYTVVDYPGLLARHLSLGQSRLGLPEVRLGETIVLMDDPMGSIAMPDWTP